MQVETAPRTRADDRIRRRLVSPPVDLSPLAGRSARPIATLASFTASVRYEEHATIVLKRCEQLLRIPALTAIELVEATPPDEMAEKVRWLVNHAMTRT